MGVFFVYMLKSSVCLAMFYLFYRMLLSKETFHHFNRIALLGVLLLSCIIPLVEVSVQEELVMSQPVMAIEEVMPNEEVMTFIPASVDFVAETSSPFPWKALMLLVYVGGILFFVLRHLWSLGRMVRLLRASRRETLKGGITLFVHREKVAPFSWMNMIAVSEEDLEENRNTILTHERAHIKNCHSWDLLLAEVCIYLQWFNPAVWLLKQELQTIHEYEADEWVINNGIDAKTYQLLIIKKAVGARLYSIANSFNHSSLKKRITMMIKKKSNPWARLKYLYVLPLATVAVAAFARPEVSNQLDEISSVKVNDLASIVKADEVKSVENSSDEKINVSGRTVNLGKMSEKERNEYLVKLAKEVIMNFGPDYYRDLPPIIEEEKNDFFKGKDIEGREYYKVTFPYDETKETLEWSFSAEVMIWKDTGEPLGVMFGTGYGINFLQRPYKEWVEAGVAESDRMKYQGYKPREYPLLIIDGKEMEYGTNLNRVVSEKQIQTMTMLKGEDALAKYGNKGKHGVYIITTKKSGVAGTENVSSNKELFTLHGQVITESSNEPLPGAHLMVVGASRGTSTDKDGKFKIKVAKGDVISCSFVGLVGQYIPVESNANIVVRMKEYALEEQEKPAVYHHINLKVDKDTDLVHVYTIKNILKERWAGSSEVQAYIKDTLNNRWVKDTSKPNGPPLVIVDGKEMGVGIDAMKEIPVDQIKSISVMKSENDAVAQYGNKAKDGVITIVTKNNQQ